MYTQLHINLSPPPRGATVDIGSRELVRGLRGRVYSQVGEVRLWPVSRPWRGW